jgi:hypothetical protein
MPGFGRELNPKLGWFRQAFIMRGFARRKPGSFGPALESAAPDRKRTGTARPRRRRSFITRFSGRPRRHSPPVFGPQRASAWAFGGQLEPGFEAGGRTGTRFGNRPDPGFRHPNTGRIAPGFATPRGVPRSVARHGPPSARRRQRHAEYREARGAGVTWKRLGLRSLVKAWFGPVRDSSRPNMAFNRNPPPGSTVSAPRCGGSG